MTCNECERPTHAKNLCSTHYRKALRARHAAGEHVREYLAERRDVDLEILRKLIDDYKEANK